MSAKPSVFVTRKLPDAVLARLEKGYTVDLNLDDRLYSSDEIVERAQNADAILPCHTEHFTAELVARLPECVKIVANFSVGVDHCDLNALAAKGIVVTNTPDVLSDATAETAMLVMLGAARRASEGERMMRDGSWKSWSPAFMVGTAITGKTLGIIGMGRVGQTLARCARGFEMDIIYYNRTRLSPDLEQGAVYYDNLDDVLPKCDVLSLNCPVTDETRGFFNEERINQLSPGTIFVNTARGALVDEAALVAALKSGHIAAAGLDVYINEPGGNLDLAALPNTFLLPHIGSANKETRDAMGFRALDNLDAYFAGNPPGDRVA
ncbi:MAG: D-glycerate dehydrogenase [Rhodospirillales bacterium]|jgi:lactate dehydrogenase-like 2-hydroxyacid dehydrogenase|nr:D-glycerate dehydrogenase [Rhodospirillales bacterium]MBT4041224.1 D-glycerate dehydrogenase [Rhodospirillales bacterium]MBT4626886.1 D-glycerate dehydrogenase [Rhodospirillales bacterium]MBT5350470.1 D-glycerate dehydrogenase [Rhodospirillales bacterium]MBT5519635.1 D-glycerate dehydrogenase [Rhodospirillales bacterium]